MSKVIPKLYSAFVLSEACKLSDLISPSHLAAPTQPYYASQNPIEFTCAEKRVVVLATGLNKFEVSCTGAAWGQTDPANAICQGICSEYNQLRIKRVYSVDICHNS